MNLLILYIIVASVVSLEMIITDIIVKKPSIVSIYIIGKIIVFSIILAIVNALNLEFVFKILLTVFTAWLTLNFLINAVINLMYKLEKKVKNVSLQVIYILLSIASVLCLIKCW